MVSLLVFFPSRESENILPDNRTIVCAIHQPRYDTFQLFDQCMLLNLGQVVYFGSVHGILPHFAPELVQPKENEEPVNPADLMLDLTHVPSTDDEKVVHLDKLKVGLFDKKN